MDIIVDLDGTVADIRHRLHFIHGKKKNYRGFYNTCNKDAPIRETIAVVNALYEAGHTIVFMSGREGTLLVRARTKDWLKKYVGMWTTGAMLAMRKVKDFRPDTVIKKEMKDQLEHDYGMKFELAIDDRHSVVKMWREEGIRTYEVAANWENMTIEEQLKQR